MGLEINGQTGIYDGVIADESVRYGRNSVENHIDYLEKPLKKSAYAPAPILDFSGTANATENNIKKLGLYIKDNAKYLDTIPEEHYKYRYMPKQESQGIINKKALIGAAYEEMLAKEMSVKDFEQRFLISDDMTAKPIDINNDGKITNNEYAATILAADIYSKETPDINGADGVINSKGLNTVLEYSRKSRAEAATKLYSEIFSRYKLDEE
ncbi:MAG: hypothetical protein MJ237_00465 [bacterium]|nr:hypothetical protein [bacterium]